MIRGTTPTLEFVLPFDTGLIAEGYITMTQNGTVKVEKSVDDFTMDGLNLSVPLTQEETLELEAGVNVEIQLRVRTETGNVLASDIYCVSADRILKEGEI